METPAAVLTQIDLRLYSVDALHAAVYRFANVGCSIEHVDWEGMTASVAFARPPIASEHASLLTRFRQELTDQVLRHRIRGETDAIRTLILAHAFSDSAIAEK